MAHRILYVNNSSRLYGAENSLLQLVRGLDRSEFEPVVAIPGPGPFADALEREQVAVVHAPMVLFRRTVDPFSLARMGAATLASVALIALEARRRGVALVHANAVAAQPVAGPAAALAGVPCLWHLRGLRCLRIVMQAGSAYADAVVAVSREVLRASGIRPDWGPELHVIHNAIDADAFARDARPGRIRAELGLGPRVPLLAMVGQMVPWKGHRRFLQALALVRREWPHAVAAVAGDASLARSVRYADELRRFAASLGLGQAVRFLGYRSDVADILTDADLLVVPSDAEPFGRVALEAMAVGTPVVAAGGGGLPEVVQDGVTGRLTRGLSPAELARIICQALSDPAARSAMGRAGYRRVRDAFGLAAHTAAICRVYRRLLAAGRRRGR